MSRAEARRLVWIIGMVFAIVLVVHYFEFPYGSVITSIFSAGKAQVLGISTFSTGDSSSKPKVIGSNQDKSTDFVAEKNGSTSIAPSTNSLAIPPVVSLPNIEINPQSPMISAYRNTHLGDRSIGNALLEDEKSGKLQNDTVLSQNSSYKTNVPAEKERSKRPRATVMSISEMNNILLHSRASSFSMKPLWSSAVDQELLNAKFQIANAPIIENDSGLYGPLYRNVSMFKRISPFCQIGWRLAMCERNNFISVILDCTSIGGTFGCGWSYELMENMLKVYIYKEGEKPIFHESILEGIYSSEGWFLKLMEASKHFVTEDPKGAHLFYLPFSSRLLELTLYVRNSHSRNNLIVYMKNYVEMLTEKYPFWNRTSGADHFLAACHDWAPAETRGRMSNCLRALCNADLQTGFHIGKDISLPTTYVRSAKNPLKNIGGEPSSNRSILAFFAGHMHGPVRPALLKHWGGKEPDMKIFSRLPHVKGNKNYIELMKSSRYCICARGFAVHSPRVVESIFYDCVPVIISDNYVPPFFEVLDWESFSVFVLERDIPNLRNVLLSIPEEKYVEMQRRVKMVQQHFLWHDEPVKYDLFHMVLHSVWYNRVFRIGPG